MPSLLPIIKTILPYLAPILQTTLPVLTKKKSEETDPLVAQQISELQEAVKTNSEATKALAKAIEEVVQANDRAMRRLQLITAVATVAAGLSIVLAVVSLLR
jgi:CHASE3 domain sensor protein